MTILKIKDKKRASETFLQKASEAAPAKDFHTIQLQILR